MIWSFIIPYSGTWWNTCSNSSYKLSWVIYFPSWVTYAQNKTITPVTSKHHISYPITDKLYSLNFWRDSLMYTENPVPSWWCSYPSVPPLPHLTCIYSHYIYDPSSANSLTISYVTLTYTDSLHSVCQTSCPFFNYLHCSKRYLKLSLCEQFITS
jgi:hypothetical protein